MVLFMALIISIGCAGTQVKHQHEDDLTSYTSDVMDLLSKYEPKSHFLHRSGNKAIQYLIITYELSGLSCMEHAQWVSKLEKELKMAKGK